MDKVAMLTQILEANPNDSFARYGLAMEHVSRGQHDAALVQFRDAAARNTDYVPAYQMAAQTLAKLGRNDEAKERLITGLEAAARTHNTHAASEMQALLDEIEAGY